MKGKKWTSKYYLLFLVALCVLVLLAAFLRFMDVLKENVNQTNYEIMQEISRQQMLSFKTKIQGQLNQLQLYARSYEKIDMNDYNAVKAVINVTEGAGSFQTISVANSNGKLVNNNNTAAGNIMMKQYFKDAIAGNTAIGLGYSADGNTIEEIIYAVPIYQNGRINGVLVGSEQRSDVEKYLMTGSFGGLGATFIVDREGNIILQSANGTDIIGDYGNYFKYLDAGKADNISNLLSQAKDIPDDEYAKVHRFKIKNAEYIILQNSVDFDDWSLLLQVDASFVNSQSSQISLYVASLLAVVLASMLVIVMILFYLRGKAERLRNKAEHDQLTNLFNKKTFENSVADMVSNCSADEKGALLIIDLDNFKGINDMLGHMAGDRVLIYVAEKMRETFRQQDYLGRIGGDEFAAYLTFGDMSDEEEVYDVIRLRAELLCRKIKELEKEFEADIKISCSIGIALKPEHGMSYGQLYQNADKALYQSKKSGKNQYRIFTREKGGSIE